MDDLRAKFNPMFAAQQRFRAVTDEISHAQRVGAISSREATDALMREQSAYEAATAAINTNTAAMQNNNAASRASGAQRANAVNLMYQGQDIAMMALLGQDPKTLALQQGLQVGGIFSQMGGGKAIVQGLTSAIGMMLNPLNVATILTIGLGAAGVQARTYRLCARQGHRGFGFRGCREVAAGRGHVGPQRQSARAGKGSEGFE
jgi:hypothetical protein